jgi:hypothetical protein
MSHIGLGGRAVCACVLHPQTPVSSPQGRPGRLCKLAGRILGGLLAACLGPVSLQWFLVGQRLWRLSQ